MKELKQLSAALKTLGYHSLSETISKIGQQATDNKPQKIIVSSTPKPNNQGYTLTVTPIMTGGKTGTVETIQYSTSKGSANLLPDKPFKDIVDKLFGPGTILSSSMIDLKLSPGQTSQQFGIVIK